MDWADETDNETLNHPTMAEEAEAAGLSGELGTVFLRTSENGMYPTATFKGSLPENAEVDYFGIMVAMGVSDLTVEKFEGQDDNPDMLILVTEKTYDEAGTTVSGPGYGDIVSEDLDVEANTERANAAIYFRPYMVFTDGSVFYGTERSTNFAKIVSLSATQYNKSLFKISVAGVIVE